MAEKLQRSCIITQRRFCFNDFFAVLSVMHAGQRYPQELPGSLLETAAEAFSADSGKKDKTV